MDSDHLWGEGGSVENKDGVTISFHFVTIFTLVTYFLLSMCITVMVFAKKINYFNFCVFTNKFKATDF